MGEWVELDERALDYVRKRLEGGLALSSSVRDLTDLATGTVVTSAATGLVTKDTDLAASIGRSSRDAIDELRQLVRSFFDRVPTGSLWVEQTLPSKSDGFWTNPEVPEARRVGWFFGEQVFSLAFSNDNDDSLTRAIGNIYDYPGWGGAAFLVDRPSRVQPGDISAEAVTKAADSVEAIICGAYDGEGYLVWRRPGELVAALTPSTGCPPRSGNPPNE